MTTTKLRAVIYARYSTDHQNDASIDDQFLLCRRLADREKNVSIVRQFADRAATSATLEDRPGMGELMSLAQAGGFEVLVSEGLDRISRSDVDLPFLNRFFAYYKIKILTAKEGWVNDMHIGFRGMMGKMFLKDVADNVRRNFAAKIENGKIPGSIAYGYKRLPDQPGVQVINEEQAKVVQRVYREYVSGRTPREIVEGLNADGIPAPRGGVWSLYTILSGGSRSMLGNPIYKGELVWGRRKNIIHWQTQRKARQQTSESEWQRKARPDLMIVQPELWEAANTLRTSKARRKGTPNATPPGQRKHLLAGLLRCGVCNGPMRITHNNGVGQRVSCTTAYLHRTCANKKSYDVGKLERAVIDRMRDELVDPARIMQATKIGVAKFAEKAKQNRADKLSLEKLLARVELKITRVTYAITESDDPVEELIAALPPLKTERANLVEQLRLLQADSNVVEFHPKMLDAYRQIVEELHGYLTNENIDPDKRDAARMAFRRLIDSVVVHQTGWAKPYDLSLYGRLSAIMGGTKLFPTAERVQKVAAAQGSALCDSAGPAKGGPTQTHNPNDVVFLGRWQAKAA